MSNDYYQDSGSPGTGAAGSSSTMRAEFATIELGFDKLSVLTGNASKAVVINGTGTAQTVTTGTLTLAGNFATSGASAITLTSSGATNVTLPTTGTLATLAGVEEFDNKTLDASVGKGTWTASGTWTLPAVTLGGAITYGGVALTNAVTGTGKMVLDTSPTIATPVINSAAHVGGTWVADATWTLPALTLGGTVSGGGQQLNNVIIGTVTPLAGSFTTGTFSSTVTLSGTAANIALGSNFLSGDGGDEGILVDSVGTVIIDQTGDDTQILRLRSSDVTTGLTSVLGSGGHTNDFGVLWKHSATLGGLGVYALGENDASLTTVGSFVVVGGIGSTTDTITSDGLCRFRVSEHDGANALTNAPANQNAFTFATRAGGAWATRMLIKGDDGELHVSNTTLVALDDEDDVSLVRAMQYEVSKGEGMVVEPWENEFGTPAWSYDALRRVGVLGERDERGECLFRVQPRFAMNEGAIWQTHKRVRSLEGRFAQIEDKLLQLEARA